MLAAEAWICSQGLDIEMGIVIVSVEPRWGMGRDGGCHCFAPSGVVRASTWDAPFHLLVPLQLPLYLSCQLAPHK